MATVKHGFCSGHACAAPDCITPINQQNMSPNSFKLSSALEATQLHQAFASIQTYVPIMASPVPFARFACFHAWLVVSFATFAPFAFFAFASARWLQLALPQMASPTSTQLACLMSDLNPLYPSQCLIIFAPALYCMFKSLSHDWLLSLVK